MPRTAKKQPSVGGEESVRCEAVCNQTPTYCSRVSYVSLVFTCVLFVFVVSPHCVKIVFWSEGSDTSFLLEFHSLSDFTASGFTW